MLQVMCNNPEVQTSSPHPETPGSGLECNYGWYGEHGPNPGQNLTTQVQSIKELALSERCKPFANFR